MYPSIRNPGVRGFDWWDDTSPCALDRVEEIGVGDFAPMDDGEVTFLTFAIAVREAEFFLKRGKGVRRIWAGTFHPDYMKIAEEYAVPISFASGAAEPRGCDNKKPYRS